MVSDTKISEVKVVSRLKGFITWSDCTLEMLDCKPEKSGNKLVTLDCKPETLGYRLDL